MNVQEKVQSMQSQTYRESAGERHETYGGGTRNNDRTPAGHWEHFLSSGSVSDYLSFKNKDSVS